MHAALADTGVYTINTKNKKTKIIIHHPCALIAVVLLLALGFSGCDREEKKPHSSKKIHESHYQQYWCNLHQGKAEVVLQDRTRCDCLTRDYAVEVDFAKKWAEAIGQSLHYARLTGKKAGVLLIINSKKDAKYARRLNDNISYYKLPIRVWKIAATDLIR